MPFLAHPHGEEAVHVVNTNIITAVAIVLLILAVSAYIAYRQVEKERTRSEDSDRTTDDTDHHDIYPPFG
jgi:heme/copper-type cytochrome/quinol oxidase subunit 2